jgi:galactonate dehydratase
MKVTDIKVRLVAASRQTWVFAKVETDEGVYGWGEGSLEGQEKAVEQAIYVLAQRVIGEDPTNIERHWQVMYRHGFWRGGVILNSALAAIDQALWDVTGKIYNLPVYKLLGGKVRDRVRAYTHASTPEQAARLAQEGYLGIKVGGMRYSGTVVPTKAAASLKEYIKSMREAVGPDVQLMIDNHGRAWPSLAIEQIRAVEEYGVTFFEEAVPPDNVDAFQRVRQNMTRMNLATGERLFSRWDYRRLIEQQLVDIIQPDVCHCGGISELRRIAAAAETYYIRVAPHNPNGPVATAASIHLGAAMPNFSVLEYVVPPSEVKVVKSAPILPQAGHFPIPEAPGLGVDLDEAAMDAFPYVAKSFPSFYYEDGGVADV